VCVDARERVRTRKSRTRWVRTPELRRAGVTARTSLIAKFALALVGRVSPLHLRVWAPTPRSHRHPPLKFQGSSVVVVVIVEPLSPATDLQCRRRLEKGVAWSGVVVKKNRGIFLPGNPGEAFSVPVLSIRRANQQVGRILRHCSGSHGILYDAASERTPRKSQMRTLYLRLPTT
jgi:hypothetical protein